MPSPSPNGRRAERDGCGCPPWVKMCAHFEGRVLVLGEESWHGLVECDLEPSGRFGVWIGEGFRAHSCERPGHVGLEPLHEWGWGYPYRTLPAAEAEFRKRELALLTAWLPEEETKDVDVQ